MDNRQVLKTFLFFFIAGVLVILDMITKSYFDGQNIVIIDGIFSFTSSHNTGAALSLLSDHPQILIIVTILFLIAIIVFGFMNVSNPSKTFFMAYVLIFAGAIGNFLDRLTLGYVRDFISLDIINFPIFNLADTCLTIGVVLFLIYIIYLQKAEKK